MNPLLAQARRGQKRLINDDPQMVTLTVSGDPADPWAPDTDYSFKARISHKAGSVPEPGDIPAGIDYDLRYMLSTDHTVTVLKRGAILTDANGVKWKLGKPDPLRRFGGIYGYQVNLNEVT